MLYPGDIENGKYITFTGVLGNTAFGAAFDLSLKDLTDGGVIPF